MSKLRNQNPRSEQEQEQEQEQSPLLIADQTHQHQQQENQEHRGEDDHDTHLDKTLQRLDSLLTLLGFNQSSVFSFGLSCVVFLLIGVSLPVVVLVLSDCSNCEEYQIKAFEIDVVVSQAFLAAASLLCLSHNLRKYGIRKFLFVDRYSGHVERFANEYNQKICVSCIEYSLFSPYWKETQCIRHDVLEMVSGEYSQDSVRLLVLWIVPCFIMKTAREIIRMLYVQHESWWHSVAILLALVVSWTYVTAIFLSACILFHLVCNLQIIHFDDYGKLLERESDVLVLIQEHVRLRYYLSKISHRFRIYLLLEFLIVTTSLFVILFQTTVYVGPITYINGGDFVVSSVVQVVGILLCLNAAAKISHRAQGIASLASRWHAFVTCSSSDTSQLLASHSMENMEALLHMNNSENDLESLNFAAVPTNTQLASYMSSYHKRQALVMYLQTNPGGITIFGWTVDRGLINTIFFIELSLVLFVFGKTVVFASE
ncbi:unnamed protein product [Ilex paraguariensis]|uniref:Odorant receptor n=1 Tax=Ilex paraguariensis TaxID=185542 RepID=A0ABC8UK00_9AQUA